MDKIKDLLVKRNSLKSQIQAHVEDQTRLEETTLKGGIFAIFKATEGAEENGPGSARWIRRQSKFLNSIEDRLKDIDKTKINSNKLCQQNVNFENIIFQVESGQLLDEEEIASQLLLFCINISVSFSDNVKVTQRLREITNEVKNIYLK